MKKASDFGLVIACIFILISTSLLLSTRSFATPIDLKVISDSSWHDPTGMSDGTTVSIDAFSVLRSN